VIEASQAGGQVACRCGAALEVPSLRGIRSLEAFTETPPPRRLAWNPTRGVVFAIGLVIVVVGLLVAAAGGVGRARVQIWELPAEELDQELAGLDQASPAEAWRHWVDMRDNGLGPYFLPPKYAALDLRKRLTWLLTAGLIVAAVGAAIAGSAFLLPQPGRRTPA
jgi:hypothetical protein